MSKRQEKGQRFGDPGHGGVGAERGVQQLAALGRSQKQQLRIDHPPLEGRKSSAPQTSATHQRSVGTTNITSALENDDGGRGVEEGPDGNGSGTHRRLERMDLTGLP